MFYLNHLDVVDNAGIRKVCIGTAKEGWTLLLAVLQFTITGHFRNVQVES